MKVIIMPRNGASHPLFSLSSGQFFLWLTVLLVVALLGGASLQRLAWGFVPGLWSLETRLHPVFDPPLPGADRALEALSVKVGVLQVKLQHLEVLGARVADLAALPVASLRVASQPPERAAPHEGGQSLNAGQLEAKLSALQIAVQKKNDYFVLLDLAMTQRAAAAAQLPTAMPISSRAQLSSSYGWRKHPFHGDPSTHEGLDFAAPAGTPILAAAGGVVRTATRQNGFGNLVELDHGDGLITRYAHALVLLVKAGELVTRGQMIARVGSTGLSTGAHLHFEVRHNDRALDPAQFLTASPFVSPSANPRAAR